MARRELGASGRRSAGARRPRRRWQGAGVRRRGGISATIVGRRVKIRSRASVPGAPLFPPTQGHTLSSVFPDSTALGTHLTPLVVLPRDDARAQPRAQAVVCVVLLHPIETTSHTSIAPLSSQPALLPCSCNPPQREPRRPASHAAFASIWFTITSHRTPIGNALHPV